MKRIVIALLTLAVVFSGWANETVAPLVWERSRGEGQPAIREGVWQRTAEGETGSGRGWESLYAERY